MSSEVTPTMIMAKDMYGQECSSEIPSMIIAKDRYSEECST